MSKTEKEKAELMLRLIAAKTLLDNAEYAARNDPDYPTAEDVIDLVQIYGYIKEAINVAI